MRRGEGGKVRWEKAGMGENERGGEGRWWEGERMHKYTEGKVKYFDN